MYDVQNQLFALNCLALPKTPGSTREHKRNKVFIYRDTVVVDGGDHSPIFDFRKNGPQLCLYFVHKRRRH